MLRKKLVSHLDGYVKLKLNFGKMNLLCYVEFVGIVCFYVKQLVKQPIVFIVCVNESNNAISTLGDKAFRRTTVYNYSTQKR